GASFPRAGALAVAGAAGGDAASDVATLVDYALVEALTEGERLRLHPQLREFAVEKLATLPETDQLGAAMVEYWIGFAKAHNGYKGMNTLDAELSGLMGAAQWAHERGLDAKVIELGYALNRYLFVRGRIVEARRVLPWALEGARSLGEPETERFMCHELAVLDARTGHPDAARAGYNRALEMARQLQNLAAEQVEVHSLAVLDAETGHIEAARTGFEHGMELARQLQNLAAERAEVHGLAVLDARAGHLEAARAGYARALQLAGQLNDQSAELDEVHSLAVLDAQTGHTEAARAGYMRALELARQLQNPAEERAEVHGLAVLDAQSGHPEAARAGYMRALELARQLHDPAAERLEVHGLALLDDNAGNLASARRGYERALELARQIQDPAAEARELRDLGELVARHENAEQGLALMREALAIFDRLQIVLDVGLTYLYLARLDRLFGNHDAAIENYRQALSRFEQILSPDANEARQALRELGALP
ncbi:MAG TPA: hypothetical protein VGR57_17625, partial [Ktedonobacterales bacterium]|nr:hypothetical protein [Ktedonobacterales bacterium]